MTLCEVIVDLTIFLFIYFYCLLFIKVKVNDRITDYDQSHIL